MQFRHLPFADIMHIPVNKKMNKTVVIREMNVLWDSDLHIYERLFYKPLLFSSDPLHLDLSALKPPDF